MPEPILTTLYISSGVVAYLTPNLEISKKDGLAISLFAIFHLFLINREMYSGDKTMPSLL